MIEAAGSRVGTVPAAVTGMGGVPFGERDIFLADCGQNRMGDDICRLVRSEDWSCNRKIIRIGRSYGATKWTGLGQSFVDGPPGW